MFINGLLFHCQVFFDPIVKHSTELLTLYSILNYGTTNQLHVLHVFIYISILIVNLVF